MFPWMCLIISQDLTPGVHICYREQDNVAQTEKMRNALDVEG